MSSTDTTEKELESTIVQSLLASGYVRGEPEDYDRDHAVDLVKLHQFLLAGQKGSIQTRGPDRPESQVRQWRRYYCLLQPLSAPRNR